jgi:hypothetical protein
VRTHQLNSPGPASGRQLHRPPLGFIAAFLSSTHVACTGMRVPVRCCARGQRSCKHSPRSCLSKPQIGSTVPLLGVTSMLTDSQR